MSSQAAADLKRPSCIIVMQAGRPVCAEPAYPIKLSLHAGNSTERLASCSNTTLPQSFTQYLNTSFLGERQFMQVGPVNYTFFQFGPLGSTIVGTYHISSSQIIFLPLFFCFAGLQAPASWGKNHSFALRCHGLHNLLVSCQS